MKTSHSGDCTIYRSLINGRPCDGVCTCSYGWERVREGDWSEMFSRERCDELKVRSEPVCGQASQICLKCHEVRLDCVPDEGDDWWCPKCIALWEQENKQHWADGSPLET